MRERLCRIVRAFSIAGVLFWPHAGAWGQLPEIRADVDTTVVTVGDRVTMAIRVDYPEGSRLIWPDSLDLSPFEVLDARLGPPSLQGDLASSSLVLTLAAFELGDLQVPPIEVGVEVPGGETVFLETNPFGIRLESVGLDESGDIRDIKGPLRIPRALVVYLLPLLGLFLAGLLFWWLSRRFWRKDPREGETKPEPPPRPPHEVALEALARLEASPLLERGEVKEYHIRASEIIRTYLEARFHLPALEMTTRFIKLGLERVGLGGEVVEGFGDFLNRCDMVKFAKFRPDPSVAHSVLLLGRELVERTVPVASEPTSEIGTTESPDDEGQVPVSAVELGGEPGPGGGS